MKCVTTRKGPSKMRDHINLKQEYSSSSKSGRAKGTVKGTSCMVLKCRIRRKNVTIVQTACICQRVGGSYMCGVVRPISQPVH